MDIFTTQLTRVVPVPIKPANLKVKALLKEAATSGLSQDPHHVENHEYYFNNEDDEYHGSKQESAEQDSPEQKASECESDEYTESAENTADTLNTYTRKDVEVHLGSQDKSKNNSKSSLDDKNVDKDKHLDLYA